MKELERARKILYKWTLTDSMDAVEEVCEVIEILDKILKEEDDPIDGPCNVDPKHLGRYFDAPSMGCDVEHTKHTKIKEIPKYGNFEVSVVDEPDPCAAFEETEIQPGMFISKVKRAEAIDQINHLLDNTKKDNNLKEVGEALVQDLKGKIIYTPYIPVQIISAYPNNPHGDTAESMGLAVGVYTEDMEADPVTLADIPLEQISKGDIVYYNGIVNKGKPSEFKCVDGRCVVEEITEDYVDFKLYDRPDLLLRATLDELEDFSFYKKTTDVIDVEFEVEGSKWNCKCPKCGGNAYRGLCSVICEDGCK